MKEKVKIVLAGINGYGEGYLRELLNSGRDDFEFSGAVDPRAPESAYSAELEKAGIPVFPSLDEFYASRRADLAVISAPIHLHVPLSMTALRNASNVLCEKPLCGDLDSALKLAGAASASDCFVAVGYQWCYDPEILRLKEDIMAGKLGRPLSMKALALWPRRDTYYDRNDWAGRFRLDNGVVVNDNPVKNALSHFLFNMFFMLGAELSRSASPRTVEAELYRAKEFDNYDTAVIRCVTDGGVPIHFCASHSTYSHLGAIMSYRFEKALVTMQYEHDYVFSLKYPDRIDEYRFDPFAMDKLWTCVEAVGNPECALPCGIDAVMSECLCEDAARKSSPVRDFPPEMIIQDYRDGDRLVCVRGLEDILTQSYAQELMPSELGGIPWAVPGTKIVI